MFLNAKDCTPILSVMHINQDVIQQKSHRKYLLNCKNKLISPFNQNIFSAGINDMCWTGFVFTIGVITDFNGR